MPTGCEVMREFVPNSPFCQVLGITLAEISDGAGTLHMPFKHENTTLADMVHGGAIGTLCDVGIMVAAWASDEEVERFRGVTIGMTVEYIGAAQGVGLDAHCSVLRRGRSLCFCEVEARTADDARALVAKAIGTYKLG